MLSGSQSGQQQSASASATGHGAPVPLQQRLQNRHRQLLTGFDETRIIRNQNNDGQAADHLVSLRTELSNHRMTSETRIVSAMREHENIQSKLFSDCFNDNNTSNNNNKPPTIPSDDIHGNTSSPEDFEQVLSHRKQRMIQVRLNVVQLAQDLRQEHLFRMSLIESLEKKLFEFEQARQDETAVLTRELVENIISIAYVNVTQAQSLAQSFLIEENERALANHVGMTALFSKLRQHELLHFRELMKNMRAVMRKAEERMTQSILVWSSNLLLSQRFREPQGRFDLIEKTRDMVLQAGRNLKHIVASIVTAAESLPRKPRISADVIPLYDYYNCNKISIPIKEDQVPCDIPGGTGDGGWLKHFDLNDPRAIQPFSKSPSEVTLEWTQALETVLEHFGSGSEELILSAQQHGKMILQMVSDVVGAMKEDLAAVFIAGPVEKHLKERNSNEYFPFLEEVPKNVRPTTAAVFDDEEEEDEQASNQQGDNTEQNKEAEKPSTARSAISQNKSSSNKKLTKQEQQALKEKEEQEEIERKRQLEEEEHQKEAMKTEAEEQANKLSAFILDKTIEIERYEREIKTECKWFQDFLSLHLLRQFEVASNVIHRNGFYSLCTQSTMLIQNVVEKVCHQVRSAVLWQEESQKDFRDNLTHLETAYQVTEERLSSAGTIDEAMQLCDQANGLLKKIENEYTGNFTRSEKYLQDFVVSALPKLIDEELSSHIFSAVCVEKIDVQKLREEAIAAKKAEAKRKAASSSADNKKNARSGGGNRSSPTRSSSPSSPTTKSSSNKNVSAKTALENLKKSANEQQQQKQNEENDFENIEDPLLQFSQPKLQSMRGSTYLVTAPIEAVMELGGTLEEFQTMKKIEIERRAGENDDNKLNSSITDTKTTKTKPSTPIKKVTKMTKAQKEELERLQQEEIEQRQQQEAVKQLLPVEEKYMSFLKRTFESIFTPTCLIAPDALQSFVLLLRSLILDWFEEYGENISTVSKKFTKQTTDQLALETHECIRRHARRPVTLQSQVFEVRVRQLQDAADSRADWFHRLTNRVHRGTENAQRGIADLEVIVAQAASALEDLREEICEATTVSGIDAQKRSLNALFVENSAQMKVGVDSVMKLAQENIVAVKNEVSIFQRDKLKTLGAEGGNLTEAEKEMCIKAISDINEAIQTGDEDVSDAASTALTQWNDKVSSWKTEFTSLIEFHRREVTFLREITEALTKTRGTLSVMISQSSAAHTRLEEAVGKLELFASGGSSGNEVPSRFEQQQSQQNQSQQQQQLLSNINSVSDFCSKSFAPPASTSLNTNTATGGKKQEQQQQKQKQQQDSSSSSSTSTVYQRKKIYETQDGNPQPTTERLLLRLKQHRVSREKKLCQDSRVAKLSELVNNLRELFCHRGLILGCIANLPEWGQNVPNQWITLESSWNYLKNSSGGLYDSNEEGGDSTFAFGSGAAGGGQKTSGRGGSNAAKPSLGAASASTNKQPGAARGAGKGGKNDPLDDAALLEQLLPPMRNSTCRLEWQAQKLLDKAEREVTKLVSAHFAAVSSSSVPGTAGSDASASATTTTKTGNVKMTREEKAKAAAAALEAANAPPPPPVVVSRASEYGADASSIKEKVSKLLLDQLGRITDHVQNNSTEYRVLVRKMQVTIHGAAEELFNSLLQFQLSTLNESVRIILEDFALYYSRILEEQRQIQVNLRAPLASPSHHKEWLALCQREVSRRSACKYELQQLASNFATEVVQSGRVANIRVAQALSSFFAITKSFILIRHLDGNDNQVPEAGQHRGLRRLLRLKLREDIGGPKVVDGANMDNNVNEKDSKSSKKNAKSSGTTTTKKSGGKNDPNANAANTNTSPDDLPDPVPLPTLTSNLPPPVKLSGLTTGRTQIPASDPLRNSEAENAAAASQENVHGGGKNAGAAAKSTGTRPKTPTKQQQAEAAILAEAAAKKKLEEEQQVSDKNGITKINLKLLVPNQPAGWLDDNSEGIFRHVALISLMTAAAGGGAGSDSFSGDINSIANAAALATSGVSASGAAGNAGKNKSQQQQQRNVSPPRGSTNSGRGGNTNVATTGETSTTEQLSAKEAARATAAATLLGNLDVSSIANGNSTFPQENCHFDPAVSFKTPMFTMPGNSSSAAAAAAAAANSGNTNTSNGPTASETRIFPVAYAAAQMSIDKLDQLISDAADILYKKLKQFEDVETRWCVSWNGAAESLGTSASASSALMKQQQQQQQNVNETSSSSSLDAKKQKGGSKAASRSGSKSAA